ncbi:MAG: prolipoprotein diacylglyceryl transferase [Oscillospiraceae bacterium]|nr:prolipoprotein diacylglyceryl transferase [Oscillospiraceae bacterium]
MYPVLFEIFGRQIGTYGMFIVLGGVAAWFLIKLLSKISDNDKVKNKDATLVFLICICGGMIGASLLRPIMRIPEIIMRWEAFRQLPVNVMFTVVFGEIVFYGGLIGGIIAMIVFCRVYKIPILPTADLFAPALALAHGFGRIGCFFGGCCYGIPVDRSHIFAVTFPQDALVAPAGVTLIATQLIEAAGLFILAVILSVIYKKIYKHEFSPYSGIIACLYGALYSAFRFALEYYRGDIARGVYGVFSTSQYISIALFVISIALSCVILRRRDGSSVF